MVQPIDRTNDLRATLQGILAAPPVTQIALPRIGSARDDARMPAAITMEEWDPRRNGASGTQSNFIALRDAISAFDTGRAASLYRRALFVQPTTPIYREEHGNVATEGKLILLEFPAPHEPTTANLRRFVAFIPSAYRRRGDDGHFVSLHYPPMWGGRMVHSPRFAHADSHYPGGFWTTKFIVDYLIGNKLLASFAAARVNAIFLFPVYRFTEGQSLDPLGDARLFRILPEILRAIERIESRLSARNQAAAGTLGRLGLSCFSFGAGAAVGLLTGSQIGGRVRELVRSCIFFDGVVNSHRERVRSLFGVGSRAGNAGWFFSPPPTSSGFRRRLVMYQQRNPPMDPNDLIAVGGQAMQGSQLRAGQTGTYRDRTNPDALEGTAHRVDVDAMICSAGRDEGVCGEPRRPWGEYHAKIQYLFAQDAFARCRRAFEP